MIQKNMGMWVLYGMSGYVVVGERSMGRREEEGPVKPFVDPLN